MTARAVSRFTPAWLLAIVASFLACYLVVKYGDSVRKLDMAGVAIEFDAKGGVSGAPERKLDALEQIVKQDKPYTIDTPAPPVPLADAPRPSISAGEVIGNWSNAANPAFTYKVASTSDRTFSINEWYSVNGFPIQTAVGSGTLSGGRLEAQFMSYLGFSVSATFILKSSRMEGTLRNQLSMQLIPVTLIRS